MPPDSDITAWATGRLGSLPDMTAAPETRDQHITDLRAALERAAALLSYEAGQIAAANPNRAEKLMGAVKDMSAVLHRTNPA